MDAILGSVMACIAIGAVYQETYDKPMGYSKFASPKAEIPSRLGMIILYALPLLVSFILQFLFQNPQHTTILLILLHLHFAKRVLECAFVHKYSGKIELKSTVMIGFSYSMMTTLFYFSSFYSPSNSSLFVPLLVFIIGQVGNFYHHWVLASLRKSETSGYVIPSGGLFSLVICPHYLFEIVSFVGVALYVNSWTGYSILFQVLLYLSTRANRTLKWYQDNFKDFPKSVKRIIPFIW
jgi:very-long-chain enoyl-CoA reductase